MGLCINYELWLPEATTNEQAAALLQSLRSECKRLGAARVSPFLRYTAADLASDGEQYEAWSAERCGWVLAQSSRKSRDGKAHGSDGMPGPAASMFYVYPGEGSEAAAFGLVNPSLAAADPEADRADLHDRWYWHAWCKTQYASAVSDEHLVHCHLIVVRAIEAAVRLGFSAEVYDETGYWESRSTDQLISEVHKMNQLVARVAGALHDAAPAVDIQSPVFDHPDFERLESEPL